MSDSQWIVCAACKHGGFIAAGARHFDAVMMSQIKPSGIGHVHWEQGFINQFGEFLSRGDAYKVAESNGQLLPRDPDGYNGPDLFSEDLY